MTSYFQGGGYDVRPPLAAAYAVASAGTPLLASKNTLYTAVARGILAA